MIELLSSPFAPTFQQFIGEIETSCLLCSPYITASPIRRLIAELEQKSLQATINVKVLTDLSIGNLLNGSTDLSALSLLKQSISHVNITYLPRIHAKVFIANGASAIIGSANFTDGGSYANFEYGVRLADSALVQKVVADIARYSTLGGAVSQENLETLAERLETLREAVRAEQASVNQKIRISASEIQRETQDNLVRIRVQGRSLNAVFSDTILYLLSYQPMTTMALNEAIQTIHPDLCDDSVDRVIDGQHFGKRWKHQVRGAQVSLKRQHKIDYDTVQRLWQLT